MSETNTLKHWSEQLQAKKISSVELTQTYLQKVNAENKLTNSFITITEDQALAQAKVADEKMASGTATTLTGVPIAHKDIFCTDGVKTSCGSKMLDNFTAPYDATVVKKFKDAGLISLGKLNMDEFAMGSSNETSFYGAVKNPWDLERVPGGSSGGSAAAVAARLAPATTATDTGGSIRQPAAFCGVTGIKPTYGRVSRFGMIAFASSLDQGGVMAHTAEDCAMLLNVMSGFDPNDSTSVDHPVPDYTAGLNGSLEGMTIGLPKEYFGQSGDPALMAVIDESIKAFEARGATFKEVSLPNTELAVPAYYVIAPAECSSNLSRFDGVRFGYRCDNPKDLEDLYTRSRAEGFGAEVKRRILVGTYALSEGYFDAYYLKAQKIRRLISNDFNNAFADVDLLLSPTTPSTAFKIGEKTSDPVSMYLSDIYTIAVNLAGVPAMSLPAGFVNNLPVGVQLIAPAFAESKLLQAAHQYQQETDWHLRSPDTSA